MDEIDEIKKEAEMQIDLIFKVGKEHQCLAEEAIGNVAALKALGGDTELIRLLLGNQS